MKVFRLSAWSDMLRTAVIETRGNAKHLAISDGCSGMLRDVIVRNSCYDIRNRVKVDVNASGGGGYVRDPCDLQFRSRQPAKCRLVQPRLDIDVCEVTNLRYSSYTGYRQTSCMKVQQRTRILPAM